MFILFDILDLLLIILERLGLLLDNWLGGITERSAFNWLDLLRLLV